MLPELSPTFAALARTRAASQPGSPGHAVPSEAEGANGSFADEVSGPAGVTGEDSTDRPEGKPTDPAREDRAETDDLPQGDRPAAAVSPPAPTGASPVDAALAAGALPAGPALPSLPALTGETAADPLVAGLAGAPAGLAPAARTPPPTGALAAAAARAASAAAADPGEAPAARTAESAEGDAVGDVAVDPDGTGPRPGTDAARTAAGSPGMSAQAGPIAMPTADRTATGGPPAPPTPAATSPAPTPATTPTTTPTTADPRAALAAQAGAPDGSDAGTETGPGTLSDRTAGDPGPIAPPSAGDRGVAATPDAPRGGEPRSTAAQPLGSQILDGIRQARDGSIEIALSPEELGSLKLTLAGDDTRLHVQIHAERPETEGLLRRHIALLQQDFRDLGYGHVSFDFGTRQDRPARFEAPAADVGGLDDAIDPVAAAAPPPRLAALPALTGRGLDLRL